MSYARGQNGRGTYIEKRITKQMEFYFSDLNLATDEFLSSLVKRNNGWISLESVITFYRLRRFTYEPKAIVKALTKTKCRLIEVNQAKTHVRRSPNFPIVDITEQMWKEIVNRTLFCDGLSMYLTYNDLVDKFQHFDEILLVRPRFSYDNETFKKTFKGSVFLIFASVKAASTFMNYKFEKYFDRQGIKLMWRSQYKKEKSNMRYRQYMELLSS